VIRNNEEFGRIWERLVIDEQSGINVSVRADDREIFDRLIDVSGYGANSGTGVEETILV
jgi:Holliday junction resolvasome RuvABC DNA-binding subunit